MTYAKIQELTEKLSTLIQQPFSFKGLQITVIDVIRAKHPKNWLIAQHFHPWFEFNYVAKGSLYTSIESTEFLVQSGQSFIIPPGIPHAHRHNKVGDDGICIRFDIKSEEQNIVSDVLHIPHAKTFDVGIEHFSAHGGLFKLQAEFAARLMEIYDLWSAVKSNPNPVKNNFANQVELYLKEYCKEKLKTDDIANAMNVSYRTLARKFKKETGLSVLERLIEIRINRAKNLLVSGKTPIYEIAAECGFENEYYFSRQFKEKEGMSPMAYRIQNKISDL